MAHAERDDPHDRGKWGKGQWLAFQEGWHTGKFPDRDGAAQVRGNLTRRETIAYDDGKAGAKAQTVTRDRTN